MFWHLQCTRPSYVLSPPMASQHHSRGEEIGWDGFADWPGKNHGGVGTLVGRGYSGDWRGACISWILGLTEHDKHVLVLVIENAITRVDFELQRAMSTQNSWAINFKNILLNKPFDWRLSNMSFPVGTSHTRPKMIIWVNVHFWEWRNPQRKNGRK